MRMRQSTREAEAEDVEGRRLFGWGGFSVPSFQRQIPGSPRIGSSMWMDEFCVRSKRRVKDETGQKINFPVSGRQRRR